MVGAQEEPLGTDDEFHQPQAPEDQKRGEAPEGHQAHGHPQDQVDQVEPPGPPAEGVHQRNHFRLVGGLPGQVDAQEHPFGIGALAPVDGEKDPTISRSQNKKR